MRAIPVSLDERKLTVVESPEPKMREYGNGDVVPVTNREGATRFLDSGASHPAAPAPALLDVLARLRAFLRRGRHQRTVQRRSPEWWTCPSR